MFFYTTYITTTLKDRSLSALVIGIMASSIILPTFSLVEPHNCAPSTTRVYTQPKTGAAPVSYGPVQEIIANQTHALHAVMRCQSLLSVTLVNELNIGKGVKAVV